MYSTRSNQSNGCLHGKTPVSSQSTPPPPPYQENDSPVNPVNDSGLFSAFLKVLEKAVRLIFAGFLLTLFAGLVLVFYAAIAAYQGVLVMLIGNGILYASHLANYTTARFAASIGATGGAVTQLPVVLFGSLRSRRDIQWNLVHLAFGMLLGCALGSLLGTVGCAILRSHLDLGGIDITHATRAGALGGIIIVPVSWILWPLVVKVFIGALLSLYAMTVDLIQVVTGISIDPYARETAEEFIFGDV